MAKTAAFFGFLAGIIGSMAAIAVGLKQILPTAIQEEFNKQLVLAIADITQNNCDIVGKWTCSSPHCGNNIPGKAEIKPVNGGYQFINERDPPGVAVGYSIGKNKYFAPQWNDILTVTDRCTKI